VEGKPGVKPDAEGKITEFNGGVAELETEVIGRK
jgi:hypothetical protein